MRFNRKSAFQTTFSGRLVTTSCCHRFLAKTQFEHGTKASPVSRAPKFSLTAYAPCLLLKYDSYKDGLTLTIWPIILFWSEGGVFTASLIDITGKNYPDVKGKISGVNIWSREMNEFELLAMSIGCAQEHGDLLSWNSILKEIKNSNLKIWTAGCVHSGGNLKIMKISKGIVLVSYELL